MSNNESLRELVEQWRRSAAISTNVYTEMAPLYSQLATELESLLNQAPAVGQAASEAQDAVSHHVPTTSEQEAAIDEAAGLTKVVLRLPDDLFMRLFGEASARGLVLSAYIRGLLSAAPAAPVARLDGAVQCEACGGWNKPGCISCCAAYEQRRAVVAPVADSLDPDSPNFKEGLAVGMSCEQALADKIRNPVCDWCGACSEQDAASKCSPDGDSCPGTDFPLSRLWELSKAAAPVAHSKKTKCTRHGSIAHRLYCAIACKGDPACFFGLESATQARWADGIEEVFGKAAAPAVEVDEAMVERAARVVCTRADEVWDHIGDFARDALMDTQRAALAAALGREVDRG